MLKRVKVNLLEICIVFTGSYLSLRRAVLCFQCFVLGFSAGFDIFFAASDWIIYVLESVNNLEEKKSKETLAILGKQGSQFALLEIKNSCSSPGVCLENDNAEIERRAPLEER